MDKIMNDICKKRILEIECKNRYILENFSPMCDEVSLAQCEEAINGMTHSELVQVIFRATCKAEEIQGSVSDYFEEMAEETEHRKKGREALKEQLKYIQDAFDNKL